MKHKFEPSSDDPVICGLCGFSKHGNSDHIGTKHDAGKARFDLIVPEFIKEVAEVLTLGAKEHGDYNWKNVEPTRFVAALHRHINAMQRGEILDKDDGKSHAAHAACNLMFLHHFRYTLEGKDGTEDL